MKPSINCVIIAALVALSAPTAALAQADAAAAASDGAAAGDGAGATGDAPADAPAAGGNAAGRDPANEAAAGGNAAAAGAGNPSDRDNYGRVIEGLRRGTLARTHEFSEFRAGTDGDIRIVTLADQDGDDAADSIAALERAIAGTGIDADYSQLPEGTFGDTGFDADDVVAAYFEPDGDLVVVVEAP